MHTYESHKASSSPLTGTALFTAKCTCFVVLFVVATLPAFANSCVPMIIIMEPLLVFALVAIIPIEAGIATKTLGTDWKKSLFISGIANCFSTVFGVPLTWLVLAFWQLNLGLPNLDVLGETHSIAGKLSHMLNAAPMVVPNSAEYYWTLPAAALILLVPFFFASVFIEYSIARPNVKGISNRQIWKWAWIANTITYSIIGFFTWDLLWRNLADHTFFDEVTGSSRYR